MFSKSRSLLLAASLVAVPMATALAQQNNPTGNMGSNNSITATPGTTADSASSPGMKTGDSTSHSTATSNYGGTAMNGTAPGATGQTVVPGSTSSQASAAAGTDQQRTGAQTSGGAK